MWLIKPSNIKGKALNIVLGIGSPFGDDQAGWLVVRQLMLNIECQLKIMQKELIMEEIDRPGLNLLRLMELDYANLFLIDMVRTNLEKFGSIHLLKGVEILGFSGMLSSHSLGVSNALGLAHVLGLDMTKIIFLGIEGKLPTLNNDISQEVLNAVPKVVQRIVKYLDFDE